MAIATIGSSRRGILELIRRGDATTRKDISERTGLSRSVVAQVVSELIAQGLVDEGAGATPTPTSGSPRGRPTLTLRPAVQDGRVAAVDIGHRHITVALASLHSEIDYEHRVSYPVDADAPGALARVDELLNEGIERLGLCRSDIRAIGVALPFPVRRASGTVRPPDALTTWARVQPGEILARAFGCPVIVDNDANLGAWGEHVAGAGRDVGSLLYVKLADGIGAGFVVDGVVFEGANGDGGEIGHIRVSPGGPLCRCGSRGCLEALVSPAAVRRRLSGFPSSGDPAAGPPFVVTAENRDVFVDAGRAIGRVVAQLCNFIDPNTVVFGGHLGLIGDPLLEGVREAFVGLGPNPRLRTVSFASAQLGVRSELRGAIDRAVHEAWHASPSGQTRAGQ